MAVTGSLRCHQCDRFRKARFQLRFPKIGGWGWRAGNVEVVLGTAGFGTAGRSAERRRLGASRLSALGSALPTANVATWW